MSASVLLPASFLAELKRRKVYHTAASYGAAMFVIWQVADIAVPALGLPPSLMRSLVIVALLGFPVALVLSWLFEVVPEAHSDDRRPSRFRWGRAALLTCAVALLIAVLGWSVASGAGLDLAEGEWILVTEPESRTSDPELDHALADALRLALTQSALVNVFPEPRVQEGLARMRRPPGAPLDESTAVELAQREGIPVVLVPSFLRVGDRFTLACRIVDPRNGRTVVSRSTRVSREDQALPAVDELARQLRTDLGESLGALIRGRVDLLRATTASLEALKAWTEGVRLFNVTRYDEAGILLQRAVGLDSTFALAQASLGQWYHVAGRPLEGNAAFDTALRHTDGLPERERLRVVGKAAEWRGNRPGALAAYGAILEMAPDDAVTWASLGYQHMRLGQNEKAIAAYHEVLRLDSLNANAWINLATIRKAMGEYEVAVPLYERGMQLQPNFRTEAIVNEEYGQTLIALGRLDDAASLFGAMLEADPGKRARGLRSTALVDMLRGRYRSAIDLFGQAVVLHEAQGSTASEIRDRAFLATALLRTHRTPAAVAELGRARTLTVERYVDAFWAVVVGLGAARAGELRMAHELLDTARARSDQGLERRAHIKVLEGVIALAEGDPAGSANSLQDALTLLPGDTWPISSLAEAKRRLGEREEAARLWAELVEKGVGAADRERLEDWVLAHYRLARVQEDLHRTEEALASYRAFLDLWGDGDPELLEIGDARARLAALERR